MGKEKRSFLLFNLQFKWLLFSVFGFQVFVFYGEKYIYKKHFNTTKVRDMKFFYLNRCEKNYLSLWNHNIIYES